MASITSSDGKPPAAAVRAPLRIHFPTATVSRPGTRLTKQDTAAEPTFSVAAQVLDNVTLRSPPYFPYFPMFLIR